jgi:REP element-mobilizing transposase RayT
MQRRGGAVCAIGFLSRFLQAPRSGAEKSGVTDPRQIIPGQTLMITCKAVSRTFRFVPTEEVVQIIWYVLAYVLSKPRFAAIDLHEFCWMSNHYHLVLTPRDDSLPDFMCDLNSLLSRALNAVRGWSGTNIEKGFHITVCTDEHSMLRECGYTLANPCNSNLVSHAHKWKGVTSVGLRYGQPRTIKRPSRGLWAKKPGKESAAPGKRRSHAGRSRLPEAVELTLVRPPVMAERSDEDVRAAVFERVALEEIEANARRVTAGLGILGMGRVREQHWNALPAKRQDLLGPIPRAAGSCKWKRIEAAQRSLAFKQAYREAYEAWARGDRNVEFPFGTYLMKRRYDVRCAPAPA